MFYVTIVMWVLSCCAVWGVSQQDARKEFGAEGDDESIERFDVQQEA